MKDINATIIIDFEGKNEEEIWRNIKYSRRKYVGQAKRAKLYCVQNNSKKALKNMYNLHMSILRDGGTAIWTYKKWKDFVNPAGNKFFYIKKDSKIVGCFILGVITEKLFGKNSDREGIRPLVFANKKIYDKYRPNDFMYWTVIKYALDNEYSFLDLGGWQINARGKLKAINHFKKQWGGEKIYYELNYPFITAIRRKLIRNFKFFWNVNSLLKRYFKKIGISAHDNLIRNAAARN